MDGEELPEVRLLRLQPGDVLVVEAEGIVDAATAERMKEILKERFPDNESLIISGGQLKVARVGGEVS